MVSGNCVCVSTAPCLAMKRDRSPASVAPAGEAPPAIAAATTATPSRTLRFVIRPPPLVPAPVYHIFLAGAPSRRAVNGPRERRDRTFLSSAGEYLPPLRRGGQRRLLSSDWNTAVIVRPCRSLRAAVICSGSCRWCSPLRSRPNSFRPSLVSGRLTRTERACVRPRLFVRGLVTARKFDSIFATMLRDAIAALPHCAGRSATGISRQSTKACTVTRAASVPAVSGIWMSAGIFTLPGGFCAGTSITGGTSMPTATPRHSCCWQVDVAVPGSPSSHASPSCFIASAGQERLVPSQDSDRSHAFASGRQTVPAGARPSSGHTALVPVQDSATSQAPADARHIVVGPRNTSGGQSGLWPVHDSATSQAPADA